MTGVFVRVFGNYEDLPAKDFLLALADVETVELHEDWGLVRFRSHRTPFCITKLGTQPFSPALFASIMQEAGYL